MNRPRRRFATARSDVSKPPSVNGRRFGENTILETRGALPQLDPTFRSPPLSLDTHLGCKTKITPTGGRSSYWRRGVCSEPEDVATTRRFRALRVGSARVPPWALGFRVAHTHCRLHFVCQPGPQGPRAKRGIPAPPFFSLARTPVFRVYDARTHYSEETGREACAFGRSVGRTSTGLHRGAFHVAQVCIRSLARLGLEDR